MKTSIIRGNGVRDSTEKNGTNNYLAEFVERKAEELEGKFDRLQQQFDHFEDTGIWYGVCASAADEAEKVIDLEADKFVMGTGARIGVKFTYGNTVTRPTFTIRHNGEVITEGKAVGNISRSLPPMPFFVEEDNIPEGFWEAGEVVDFVYDGNKWLTTDGGVASKNSYGVTKLSSEINSDSESEAATPLAVKTANDTAQAARNAAAAVGYVVDTSYAISELAMAAPYSDRYSSEKLPLNMLVLLENDLESDFIFFQEYDNYGTELSEVIPAGERRLVVKLRKAQGGADNLNGHIFVISDKRLLAKIDAKAPKSHASSANTYGAGTNNNYGHVKLSDATDSASDTSGGTAATPAAVKAVADAVKTANDTAQAARNAAAAVGYVVDTSYAISELAMAAPYSDRYSSEKLPLNMLVLLENDLESDFIFFQEYDNYGTELSEVIPAGERRLVVKLSKAQGGADNINGHIFVISDKSLLAKIDAKAPKSHASSANTYGAGTNNNYGHVKLSDATDSASDTSGGTAATPKAVKTVADAVKTANDTAQAARNAVNDEATERKNADNALASKTTALEGKESVLTQLLGTTAEYYINNISGILQVTQQDSTNLYVSLTNSQKLEHQSMYVILPREAEYTDIHYTYLFSTSYGRAGVSAGETAVVRYDHDYNGHGPGFELVWHSTIKEAAPKYHASPANTYGAGTNNNYGHVKLSDATDSASDTSGGTAATPKAVKTAYDLANSKANASHTHKMSDITDFATEISAATEGAIEVITVSNISSAVGYSDIPLSTNRIYIVNEVESVVDTIISIDGDCVSAVLNGAILSGHAAIIKLTNTFSISANGYDYYEADIIAQFDADGTVDGELSTSSENPVQNKIVKAAIDALQQDIAAEATARANADTALQTAIGYRTRSATVVVAASNSGTKSKNAADFVCTGTNDQNVINSAINALPSTGGKVVLLEGAYNFSNTLTISKANTVIEGMGMRNTIITYTGSNWNGAIYISGNDVTIRHLGIKGSMSYCGIYCTGLRATLEYVYAYQCGYGFNSTKSGTNSYHTIRNMYLDACLTGIHLNTNRCSVIGCTAVLCTSEGINIEGSYHNITGNYLIATSSTCTLKFSPGTYNLASGNRLIGRDIVDSGSNNTKTANLYSA